MHMLMASFKEPQRTDASIRDQLGSAFRNLMLRAARPACSQLPGGPLPHSRSSAGVPPPSGVRGGARWLERITGVAGSSSSSWSTPQKNHL